MCSFRINVCLCPNSFSANIYVYIFIVRVPSYYKDNQPLTKQTIYLEKWVMGPMGEPIIITLLDEHNIKLMSSDLLLWPEIGVSFSPHQGSFFFSRCKLTQTVTIDQVAENET